MDTLNRKQEPAFRDIEKIKLIQPEVDKLANGIDLYYIDASDAELVRIEFVFSNPAWVADQPLAISATNHLLNEGTTHYTAAQLAEKIDFYGAFYQHEAGFDQSTITLYSLNKHLKSTLPIIKEIITEAVFPEEELNTYKQNSKQKLQVNQQKNDFLGRMKMNEVLFGSKSGYGYNAKLTDYDNLNRETLLSLHKRQYHAGNCTIIISGKVSQHERELIAEIFGGIDWLHNVDSDVNNVSYQSSSETKHFVERPDALQSAIRIGKVLFNKTHPDFAGMQILNTVLGGYFGSRLMSNIREDKGYTYGIGSGMASLKDKGYFFITTEVGADVCNNAITEIYKEIDRLKTEPIPAEELDLVRNYLLGTFQGSLENAFSYADKFRGIFPYGLGYDYYDRYFDTIRTISPKRLQELASQYLNDGLLEVVVGKK